MLNIQFSGPKLSRFFFADVRFAWFWLAIRLYIGYEWFLAGWGKLNNSAWTGDVAGTAVENFLKESLQKTTGQHPDVPSWYAYFIQNVALPNSAIFSYLVVYGELAVGIALILGLFAGTAAFFGAFMNFNYLFAGAISANPIMILAQIFLILGWRTAGWIGLDGYVLSRKFLKVSNPSR